MSVLEVDYRPVRDRLRFSKKWDFSIFLNNLYELDIKSQVFISQRMVGIVGAWNNSRAIILWEVRL